MIFAIVTSFQNFIRFGVFNAEVICYIKYGSADQRSTGKFLTGLTDGYISIGNPKNRTVPGEKLGNCPVCLHFPPISAADINNTITILQGPYIGYGDGIRVMLTNSDLQIPWIE